MLAYTRMMPTLQAEESMRAAECAMVGASLDQQQAEVVFDTWYRSMNGGNSRRRPKAPPIPRHLLGAIGMGLEDVPSHG